jgi:hypothetical protein
MCCRSRTFFKFLAFTFIEIVIVKFQKMFMINECMNWSVEWLSVGKVARYGNFNVYHWNFKGFYSNYLNREEMNGGKYILRLQNRVVIDYPYSFFYILQREVIREGTYLTYLSVLTNRSSMYSGVGVKAERGKTDNISAASFPRMMSLWTQSMIAERAGSVPAWATESRKASLYKIFRTVKNILVHIPCTSVRILFMVSEKRC